MIQGNYIGTDPTGMESRPSQRGIHIGRTGVFSANDNLIGGLVDGAGNWISGNISAGIEIDGGFGGVENDQVIGNWIDVDSTGNAALPNGTGVVLINSTSTTNVSLNVINGNITHGVLITGGSELNQVIGNYVGIGPDGATAILTESLWIRACRGARHRGF